MRGREASGPVMAVLTVVADGGDESATASG
jgi:hypothetical protein